MSKRTRFLLISTAAVALTWVATAGFVTATPAAGVTSTTIVSGQLDPMNLNVGNGLDWKVRLKTQGLTDIQVVENRVAPGGSFGWHSHPGPSLIVVKQGTITFYRADDPSCTPDVRTAGQTALVDDGTVHIGRNEGAVEVVVIVTRFIPAGAAARIDQPLPGNCGFWPMRHVRLVRRLAPVVVVALASACATAAPPAPTPASLQPPASEATAIDYVAHPGEGAELAPGTYVMAVGPLRVRFTVPAGWYKGTIDHVVWESGSNSSVAFSHADNLYVDPCDRAAGLRDPAVGPTVSDLVAALRDVPGVSVSAVSDVAVAGYIGKRVELTGAEPGACDEGFLWGGVGDAFAMTPGPGETFSLLILDAGGARLVVGSGTRPEITPEAEAELEAIIESIRVEGS